MDGALPGPGRSPCSLLTQHCSVPLTLAVPAAVAASAYLNARWSIPNDWSILSSLALARIKFKRRAKRDRINGFYHLEEHAKNPETADKDFLVYGSQTWTFAQAYDLTLRYAGWLHTTHGVTSKEIIAVDFMNSPQFLFLMLSIWSLGAIPAFINYNLTGESLVHCVRISTARLLIYDPEIRSKLSPEVLSAFSSPTFRNSAFPLQVAELDIPFTTSLPYFPLYRAPDSARAGLKGRDPAMLIYTSGTTGLPKAAVAAWERTTVGAAYIPGWMGLRPVTHKYADRFYTCMPFYHATALVLGFYMCLVSPTTFIISHKFSASKFWPEVKASKATVIQYVGETLRYLLAAPPSPSLDQDHQVRMAFGNGLRPDVWDTFKARFGIGIIAEIYSATEGTSGSYNYSVNDFASGAIGRTGAISGLLLRKELVLVQVDWSTETPFRNPATGFCEVVPRGSLGELLYALDPKDVKERYGGYFGNEKATESKILRDVVKRGDAWFRTGDVMRWDTEGRFWFSDRIGDTFRWKSENVSTNEVSEVLGRHPRVLEANVYGVEIPSHDGRAGCAAVSFDSATPSPETLQSLAATAVNSLPRYAVPIFIRLLKEVQATGNNKQQKHRLRTEGVDPDEVSNNDTVYWLRQEGDTPPTYVPFTRSNWESIKAAKVKL